jgi:hypothetical protein
MASQGHAFDHHCLVEKIGHRKFVGASEADIVASLRSRIPLSDEQLFDRKLKTPAGIERQIGKVTFEQNLADLVIRPVIGTDLIRTTNTERTLAPTTIDRLFQE